MHPRELWANLGWPYGEPEAGTGVLSESELESVDVIFREAIQTMEGRLAIALATPAEETSHLLYVYYEPGAYLVVVIDPFENQVSISVNRAYWDALEPQFMDATRRAEALLREKRIVEALVMCIHEGCGWVRSMMKMGPP